MDYFIQYNSVSVEEKAAEVRDRLNKNFIETAVPTDVVRVFSVNETSSRVARTFVYIESPLDYFGMDELTAVGALLTIWRNPELFQLLQSIYQLDQRWLVPALGLLEVAGSLVDEVRTTEFTVVEEGGVLIKFFDTNIF